MDTGASEEKISLFEVVVRMSRESICGSRSESCCLKSMIEVELSIGRDKVDGRPRPGNEVKRTLIIRGAISNILWEEMLGNLHLKRGQEIGRAHV